MRKALKVPGANINYRANIDVRRDRPRFRHLPWLDENLPRLIERMVQSEFERVDRKRQLPARSYYHPGTGAIMTLAAIGIFKNQ